MTTMMNYIQLSSNQAGVTPGFIQKADPDLLNYPAYDEVTVLGQVYLPRIYGKDLSAFEIASSGKIAITLKDMHSFDLERDTASNINFLAKTGDNFKFITDRTYFTTTAAGDATLFADSNVSVTASNQLSLTAEKQMAFVTGSNMVITSSNDMVMTASNDFALTAKSAIDIISTTDYIAMQAAVDVVAHAGNDMLLSAHSNVSVTASNADMDLVAKFNMTGTASNISWASSNFQVATSNLTVTASNFVQMTTSNLTVTSSNFGLYTSDSATISSSNDLMISASNDLTLDANAIIMRTQDFQMTTGGGYAITASNAISFTSVTSNVNLYTGCNFNVQSGKDIVQAASNDFLATSMSNMQLFGWASNASLEMTKVGTEVHSKLRAGTTYVDLTYNSNITANATDYNFKVNNSNIVVVTSDKVTINADLDIMGIVNSITVTESNLAIEDRRVIVGASHTALADSVNTGAGLYVQGLPSGVTFAGDQSDFEDTTVKAYEKSFTYVHEAAAAWSNLGKEEGFVTGSAAGCGFNEPYWNVKGGSLAISHSNSTQDVTFGFRINQSNELEIVKKQWDGTKYVYKKVAKFGRTIL